MEVKGEQGRPVGQQGKALWRQGWVKLAGVVVLLALIWLAVARVNRSDTSPVTAAGPRVSVATLSGSTFSVPAGKPTALWFTANGCRSCIPKAQALARIKREAGDRIAILGVDISPTDTEADFRGWIREVGDPPFDFAMDKDGRLTVAWGVRDTSTVVIVDPKGKIVYRSAGAADEATFRSAFAKAGLR